MSICEFFKGVSESSLSTIHVLQQGNFKLNWRRKCMHSPRNIGIIRYMGITGNIGIQFNFIFIDFSTQALGHPEPFMVWQELGTM